MLSPILHAVVLAGVAAFRLGPSTPPDAPSAGNLLDEPQSQQQPQPGNSSVEASQTALEVWKAWEEHSGRRREKKVAVPPGERHIQYVHVPDHGAGIGDRSWGFNFLLKLGAVHNATVHIHKGKDGACDFLSTVHSREISCSWDRYFDTAANGGSPWNPLVTFSGCRSVFNFDTNWLDIFNHGTPCVNIEKDILKFRRNDDIFRKKEELWLQSSEEVINATEQVRQRYSLTPGTYGAVHIRRRDRLPANGPCTEPSRILKTLKRKRHSVSKWVVFMYAEDEYPYKLRKALAPLKLDILYDDNMTLNTEYPADNYFTFEIIRRLMNEAQVQVETHECT